MAKKETGYTVGRNKPPVHGRIKKGEVRNPLGARAHDPFKRRLKHLTTEELRDVACLVINGNIEELKAIAKDPATSALKVWLCSVALKGIARGDVHSLDKLLERLIGKVPQAVNVGDPNGNPLPPAEVHVHIPSNGREKL